MIAVLSIAASVAGIALLASADAKRGRAAGLRRPPLEPRVAWAARALIFAPGVLLAGIGAWSPFAIWIGAVSVIGWGVAAAPVGWWVKAAAWVCERSGGVFGALSREFGAASALFRRARSAITSGSRRMKALEDRVDALEAELRDIRRTESEADEREAA